MLFGLLWIVLINGQSIYLVYWFTTRSEIETQPKDSYISVRREQYACDEIEGEEFDVVVTGSRRIDKYVADKLGATENVVDAPAN